MSLEDQLAAQRHRAYALRSAEEREVRAAAVTAVADARVAERAVHEGDQMPQCRLEAADGVAVDTVELLRHGPLVISFYRGGWCPYCNLELKAYQGALARIAVAGIAGDAAAGGLGLQFGSDDAHAGDPHLPATAEDRKRRRRPRDPGYRGGRLQAGAVIATP